MMDIPRCPNCGFPAESSNYYIRSMTLKCRHCGHSSLPLTTGVCIYDKIKKVEPNEPFRDELNPRTFLSRFAIVSLFSSLISLWSAELRTFSLLSFGGCIVFSLFYGFLRLRDPT